MENEKTGVPLDEINTDAPPNGVPGQPQPPGFPPGQFGKPHEQSGFLIVNPTNCNISFGNSNELQNAPIAQQARVPVHGQGQMNDLNSPRGVPTVNLTNNNQGSPAYVNKVAPEYYDEADRIDAYYNGPSEC